MADSRRLRRNKFAMPMRPATTFCALAIALAIGLWRSLPRHRDAAARAAGAF